VNAAEIIAKGERAEKLLKNELLIEAFEQIKAALMEKWATSPVRDQEGREYLFLQIKATNDARGYLEQVMRDGKVTVHSQIEESRWKKLLHR
jgi:ribosome-associated protein YbcJ (S4-like RNA binding protein)